MKVSTDAASSLLFVVAYGCGRTRWSLVDSNYTQGNDSSISSVCECFTTDPIHKDTYTNGNADSKSFL